MLKNSVRLLLAAVLVFLTAGCIKDPEFQPADMGVSVEELSFSKDGGEATVSLLSNRDWETEITVTRGTADWIALSDTAGTASGDSVAVTVTVLPNTGEDRDAVLRFTTGTVYAQVNIVQPGEFRKSYMTIAEFLQMPVNDETWYELCGTITDIASTQYGNLTIADETGSLYIYGLTATKQSGNDQSFASLGLEVGDELVLMTLRGEFNGEPQGGGRDYPAYYVSHTPGGSQPDEGDGYLVGDYSAWNAAGTVTSFLDDFSTVESNNAAYENDNWLFWSSDANGISQSWKTGTFDNSSTGMTDKYIQIAPYNSSLDEVVAYALPPRADVAGMSPRTFTFSKALYHLDEGGDDSRLEVVVSTDFSGDFEAASWTVVEDVSFPAGAERNQWVEETVDLSAYASESSLCIALRYTGKSNTYRIDNVGYGDGEAAPYLSLSGSGTTVTSEAGSLTFQVSSNVTWTVASDNTDFTPSPASGDGQGQITVTYTANTTGEDRTAVITVIPGGGDTKALQEVTYTIVQKREGASIGGEYTSNVGLPTVDNSNDASYIHSVLIDGEEYPALKLGTGTKAGTYTTPALPQQGDLTLGMYVMSWSGKNCELTITVNNGGTINGQSSVTVEPRSDGGVAGSEIPYVIEGDMLDYYMEFALEGVTSSTTLTFSTVSTAPRCVITGLNVNPK